MVAEPKPDCCSERTCQRKSPIRVMRSSLTGVWYVVTEYAETGPSSIEARQKHELHPDDAARLELGHQALLQKWAAEAEAKPLDIDTKGKT